MLYPLSYEGLACPFALDTASLASAGLAPHGLCRVPC